MRSGTAGTRRVKGPAWLSQVSPASPSAPTQLLCGYLWLHPQDDRLLSSVSPEDRMLQFQP